jgi:hypothetical protein
VEWKSFDKEEILVLNTLSQREREKNHIARLPDLSGRASLE